MPGKKFWVLSRALVIHKYITFPPEVKGSKRFNLVNLQARTHSPYSQMRSYMHWTETGVSVWMWDHKIVQRKIKREKLNEKEFTFIPETAFISPHISGPRLVTCREGYEGQIWQDGQLIASRWWENEPKDQEWLVFIRGAGKTAAGISQAVPSLIPSSDFLPKKWTYSRPIAGGFTLESLYSAEALALLTLLLLMPIGFYSGKILHSVVGMEAMKSDIARIGTDTDKVQLEKKAAEKNLKKINALAELNPHIHPIHVLGKVISALEKPQINLAEFKVTNDLVTLLLQGEKAPDPAEMVKLFEAIAEFDKVNADPGRNKNSLKVTFRTVTQKGGKK